MELFPTLPGLTWNIKKTPTVRNLVAESDSGRQYRVGRWPKSAPILQFHLEFEILRDQGWARYPSTSPWDEYNTLRGFFLARAGSLEDFLYYDPYDHGDLAIPQQLIADGSGGKWTPLQVVVGAGLNVPAQIDVTDLVPNALALGATLNVYDNGVLKTLGTDYAFTPTAEGLNFVTIDPMTGLITGSKSFTGLFLQWLVAPAGPITADFNFYHRVHFGSYQGTSRNAAGQLDALELSNLFQRMWEARTVEFETSRP